jgi:hypothetical protein
LGAALVALVAGKASEPASRSLAPVEDAVASMVKHNNTLKEVDLQLGLTAVKLSKALGSNSVIHDTIFVCFFEDVSFSVFICRV